jgi:hypothetical protein
MGVASLVCTYLYGSLELIRTTVEGFIQIAKNLIKKVDSLAAALMNTCRILMDKTMSVMIKLVKQYEKELMDMLYSATLGKIDWLWCGKLWNCLALLAELIDENSWLVRKIRDWMDSQCKTSKLPNQLAAIAQAAKDFDQFRRLICEAGFTVEFGISYIKQLFNFIKGAVEEYLAFITRQWKRLKLLAEEYLNTVIDWGVIDWLEKLMSFFTCAFDDSASCAEIATADNFYQDAMAKLKLQKDGEGYDLSKEYKNSIYGPLEGAKKMAKQLQLEVDDAYDKCVDPQKLKAAEKAVNLSEHLFPGGMTWTDIKEGRWEKHSLVQKYHMEKEKLKKIWRDRTKHSPSVNFLESYETDDEGNVWLVYGCNRWLVNDDLEKEGEKLDEPKVIEFTANIPVGHSLVMDENKVYMLAEAAIEIKTNPDSDFSKECIAISNMINGWLRNPDGAKRYNDKVFV